MYRSFCALLVGVCLCFSHLVAFLFGAIPSLAETGSSMLAPATFALHSRSCLFFFFLHLLRFTIIPRIHNDGESGLFTASFPLCRPRLLSRLRWLQDIEDLRPKQATRTTAPQPIPMRGRPPGPHGSTLNLSDTATIEFRHSYQACPSGHPNRAI